jgi:predicted outer membrane repeat protein
MNLPDCVALLTHSSPPAGSGGGLLSAAVERLSLSANSFSSNRAAVDGGGASIHFALKLTVAAGSFDDNDAASGSGLHVTTANAFDALYQPPWLDPLYIAPDILDRFQTMSYSVSASSFAGNRATGLGGGMLARANAVVAVAGCNFTANSATMGGAVAAGDRAGVDLRACRLDGNSAAAAGGGVYAGDSASVAVSESGFSGNRAAYGGALASFDAAAASLTDVSLDGNSAAKCGGAVAINSTSPLALAGVVDVRGNAARTGGAACALLSDAESQVCAPALDQYPFLLSAAPGARVALVGNTASGGGGALYAHCCVAPDGATVSFGRNLAIPHAAAGAAATTAAAGLASWDISGNTAAYGPAAAALPDRLELDAASVSAAYTPGDVLRLRLRLRDGLGQTVRPAVGERFELWMDVPQPAAAGGGVKEYSVFCGAGGADPCDTSSAGVRLPWPSTASARGGGGGSGAFAAAVAVTLRLRPEAGAPVLAPAVANLTRRALACGQGSAFDPDSGFCAACGRGQYVTDPDGGRCIDCPVGAECDGAALVGVPPESGWAVGDGGMLRLETCPAG